MKTFVITLFLFASVLNSLNAQNNSIAGNLVYEDGNPNLQWNTQKEVNSSYFIVESSAGNQTSVDKLKAAGYSSRTTSYVYERLTANAGALYYRATLVSMSGERSRRYSTRHFGSQQVIG